MAEPLILLAAGGTGGHLFPAEALGVVLMQRGLKVRLVTDSRAIQYSGLFSDGMFDVVPSETLRSRSPVALARAAFALSVGTAKALALINRLKPAAVVGFGGYPTVPPVAAATLLRVPTVIHDSNAVLGRANRLLAKRVTAIATSLPGVFDRDPGLQSKSVLTGTPLRPAVISAAAQPYVTPTSDEALRLTVFGGSQGARIMADIVPGAIAQLAPELQRRIKLVQQVRDEDLARVREVYDPLKIDCELAPFFTDLPQRLAAAHLVVSRSGAGTVAELAALGRPAILVPLPGAIDQDQFANAGVLMAAGGAIRIAQTEFTPGRLAMEIETLAANPARLGDMAAAAQRVGRLDAAERLADLVMMVAGLSVT